MGGGIQGVQWIEATDIAKLSSSPGKSSQQRPLKTFIVLRLRATGLAVQSIWTLLVITSAGEKQLKTSLKTPVITVSTHSAVLPCIPECGLSTGNHGGGGGTGDMGGGGEVG